MSASPEKRFATCAADLIARHDIVILGVEAIASVKEEHLRNVLLSK